MYPANITTQADVQHLIANKEFYQLQYRSDLNARDSVYSMNELILGPQQFFAKYFINPNTEYKRLICKHGTGTGKSLTALIVGLQFVELNKYVEHAHKIIIVGYTKSIFIKELLNNPSLGFVTPELKNRYYYLLKNTSLPEYQQELNTIRLHIAKQLSNKIIFYGYKELYQKFFIYKTKTSTSIWDTNVANYEKLWTGLLDKTIQINTTLLDTFKNAFVICDEVHNVYNSKEINNYGLTLQFIFNFLDYPSKFEAVLGKHVKPSNVWILLLSATLLNTSPTEIVDLINIIVPLRELPNETYITKSAIFNMNDMSLLPNTIQTIQALLYGKVSYFMDSTANYPSYSFDGESIKNIDFIKFDRCVMSPLHMAVYKEVDLKTLDVNDISLLDGIIPAIPEIDDSTLGYYKNKRIISALSKNADLYKKQFNLQLHSDGGFMGEFFKYDNIKLYSTKYTRLLDIIFENLRNDGGKIIIIHQLVKYWGVLTIAELLIQNGIIAHDKLEDNNTLCTKCGIPRINHTDETLTHYMPAKFITVHGNIEKNKIDDLVNLFRGDNTNGYKYRILLGSQIINQSYNFNNVQQLLIVSPPISYSDLIQIKGRAVRKNSHIELPVVKRHVSIRILVSSLDEKTKLSIEEYRYCEKSAVYKTIQIIDKAINECAIDNYLFYNYLNPKENTFISKSLEKMDLNPKYSDVYFNAHYNLDELKLMLYMIKVLFSQYSTVWHINDLWQHIIQPPFYIPVNTSLFKYSNFIIIINSMCDSSLSIFNLDYIIYVNGMYCRLELRNDYLFMVNIEKILPTKRTRYENTFVAQTLDFDPWNSFTVHTYTDYNIQNTIQTTNVSNNEYIESLFMTEYKDKDISEMPHTFEKYTVSFHLYFIEKIIVYFCNYYIKKQNILSDEIYEFYTKCLFFYDNLELILFSNQCAGNADIMNIYNDYIYSIDDVDDINCKIIHKHNPFLLSILKNKCNVKLSNLPIVNSENKILDMALPVGHFISKDFIRAMYPKVYDINNNIWINVLNFTYVSYVGYEVENDIIIGYYYSSSNSLEYKFKIRKPLSGFKYTGDARLIERGTVCSTKDKAYLLKLVKQLDIDISTYRTTNLCLAIKNELIAREINEITKWYTLSDDEKKVGKKIKWIYFPYEQINK